jgi:hypothetical protein
VGKGRFVAGIIRYAMRNGMAPIFVTEKPDLYGDILRDLTDIGMADVKPVVTNAGFAIPMDDDAMAWSEAAEAAKARGEKPPAQFGQFLKTPEGGAHAAQLRQYSVLLPRFFGIPRRRLAASVECDWQAA